jgi:branched-chain amino acid transport system substrate-binding protein
MVDATGKALEGTPGNVTYSPDLDNARNKAFVAAWKAKFNRVPTDNEGLAYNGAQVIFEGVKKAKSVKPGEVSKALNGATLDTVFGQAQMRAADNQLVIPNLVGRAKVMDGQLRPVVEQVFPASLTPAASPLCKMGTAG